MLATEAVVLKESLPARGQELLQVMKENVQAFFLKLCLNHVSPSPFFEVPIVHRTGSVRRKRPLSGGRRQSVRLKHVHWSIRQRTAGRETERGEAWLLAVKDARRCCPKRQV